MNSPPWNRMPRVKCLICKAFSLHRASVIAQAIPNSSNPAIPAEGGSALMPHGLARVLVRDVLACGRGMRAYAWAKGRGVGRAFDPRGGMSPGGRGGRKKRNPFPSP